MTKLSATVLCATYLIAIFISTHLPQATVAPTVDRFGDKWIHLGAFGILGILLSLAIGTWATRKSSILVFYLALAVGAIYAVFDESTQPIFGRHFEVMDLVSDGIGLAIGGACLLLFLNLQNRSTLRSSVP